MADHSSRIAVVTGAGSGIGAWNAVVAVNLHLLVTIRCDLQFEARWTGKEKRTAPRDLAHRTKLDIARCIYQQAAGRLLHACRAELVAGDHAARQPALAVPWARVR
jgi:NAD(P)-dependent dehydrogenase (short-subunit alcohol dehydrogenase family)